MEVPTVTMEELKRFHSQHFSSPADSPASRSQDGLVQEAAGDDDLGYYPDGLKRTLTDDQISMFRHSEIEALLKEDKLRAQADETGSAASQEETSPQQIITTKNPMDDPAPRQPKPSFLAKVPKADDRNQWTHRRIAREQDQDNSATIELDY